MTEKIRSQVQASEIRFLQRIEEVRLFDKVSSSEIQKSLNIEPLLLQIKRFLSLDGLTMKAECLRKGFQNTKQNILTRFELTSAE